MKKIFICLLLLLCGCSKEEKIINDNNNYKVAVPYKENIGNYTIDDYDIKRVDKQLMDLSKNYFKTNNTLYQNGQYLKNEDIKNILEKLNQNDKTNVISIYEQNYLTQDNKLKGISLAVIVKNDTLNENKLLDSVLTNINKIIEIIRNKEELKNTKLLIGIYLDSNFNGVFKYIGYTDSNSIKMKKTNLNNYDIESEYIMKNDIKTYNTLEAIKKELDNKDIYINSYGLYQNKLLKELIINLNKSDFKKSEILYIDNLIINNLISIDGNVFVYYKTNNNIKAILKKQDNKIESMIVEE